MKIVMKSDGGARGNPGPAGIGVVVWKYQVSGIEYQEKGRLASLDPSQAQDDKKKVQDEGGAGGESRNEFGMTRLTQNDSMADGGDIIKEISEYIGETTNNQAEYKALIAGLEWLLQEKEILNGSRIKSGMTAETSVSDDEFISCLLDSELVVKQLNREYKMKNEGLKPLFEKVNNLVKEIGLPVKFAHIYREENKEADRLVNMAIDAATQG